MMFYFSESMVNRNYKIKPIIVYMPFNDFSTMHGHDMLRVCVLMYAQSNVSTCVSFHVHFTYNSYCHTHMTDVNMLLLSLECNVLISIMCMCV